MRNKLGAKVLLVLGVLAIAAGFVVKLAVVPSLAKFPDDVDSTRTYAGVVNILNRAELENPTGSPLFFTGLPVISDRTVQTVEVDGDGALVSDIANLKAAPGTPIEDVRLTGSEDYYTIDRVTMEAIDNFAGDDRVLPREGLVVGFPIDTEARDYVGWNGDPAQTVTLVYNGQEEREGRDTYKFSASSGPLPIVDEGTLAEFPAGLPKAAVPALAPLLDLPPEILGALDQVLPLLPDVLPLEYTYEFSASYWVDPLTGVLIDINKNDIRKAIVSVPGLPLEIPPVEVYNLTYSPTEESLADAVDDAEDYGNLLTLGRTTVPIGLWVLGAILLVAGVFMLGRRPAEPAAAAEEPADEA
ncbi:MAG: porin PorA family protein [Acidimicrobiia bacterium]